MFGFWIMNKISVFNIVNFWSEPSANCYKRPIILIYNSKLVQMKHLSQIFFRVKITIMRHFKIGYWPKWWLLWKTHVKEAVSSNPCTKDIIWIIFGYQFHLKMLCCFNRWKKCKKSPWISNFYIHSSLWVVTKKVHSSPMALIFSNKWMIDFVLLYSFKLYLIYSKIAYKILSGKLLSKIFSSALNNQFIDFLFIS